MWKVLILASSLRAGSVPVDVLVDGGGDVVAPTFISLSFTFTVARLRQVNGECMFTRGRREEAKSRALEVRRVAIVTVYARLRSRGISRDFTDRDLKFEELITTVGLDYVKCSLSRGEVGDETNANGGKVVTYASTSANESAGERKWVHLVRHSCTHSVHLALHRARLLPSQEDESLDPR